MIINSRWIFLSLLVAADIYCQSILIGCYIQNSQSIDNNNFQLFNVTKSNLDCPPQHPYTHSIFQSNLVKSGLDLENFGKSLYLSFDSSQEVRSLLMRSAGMFAVAERILILFFVIQITFHFLVAPALKFFSIILILLLITRIVFAIYNLSESIKLYDTLNFMWVLFRGVFSEIDRKLFNYGENLMQYFGENVNKTQF